MGFEWFKSICAIMMDEEASMRVFISFSHDDKDVAARLEEALRRRNVETWSALDLLPGENWMSALDKASASADGFIFLLGNQASQDPDMLGEWRKVLRNDSESKKALIPIVYSKEPLARGVPAFLRNRQLLRTLNFDELVDRIIHLLQHPAETRDH